MQSSVSETEAELYEEMVRTVSSAVVALTMLYQAHNLTVAYLNEADRKIPNGPIIPANQRISALVPLPEEL